MFCLKCHQKTQVTNSRHANKKSVVWRRRSCISCGYIFTTYESVATDQLSVVGGGHTHSFSAARLLLSIADCFEHMPKERAEHAKWLSEAIIHKLISTHGTSFNTEELTVTAFDVLKNFDRLAAIQYGARHSRVLASRLRQI